MNLIWPAGIFAKDWQEAIRLWHGGKDTKDIAIELNVPEHVIYNNLPRKMGRPNDHQ